MSIYDPPSDPYGNEKRCRVCDELLEYNPLIRGWECIREHEAAKQAGAVDQPAACPACGTLPEEAEHD